MARWLGVVVGDYVEDRVEAGEYGQDRGLVLGEELALVDGGVGCAEQVEDGGAGLGGVQVVGKRSHVLCLRGFGSFLKRWI